MNRKQRKTYDSIFVDPIRRNIVWDDKVMAQEYDLTSMKFPLIFIPRTHKRN
jgi:hypothetical protein